MKPPLIFEILTLFPELYESFLRESLIGKAIRQRHLEVNLTNFREFGLGKHRHVDDEPYGGGPGMLLRPEPIVEALEQRSCHYESKDLKVRRILLTPQGQPFVQSKARELSESGDVLMLVCGRYEGFDERIRSWVDEEISGGDFICLGGEVISMVVIEAVARLKDQVIGNQHSVREETFSEHGVLEYPQYTRPVDFRGQTVPEILRSGHHARIHQWRLEQARERTLLRRPDLVTATDKGNDARFDESGRAKSASH